MASYISLTVEKAYEMCKAHREKHGVKIFSQCWGCVKYSKDAPEKMCFYKPPDNNACRYVNKQFEESNR